jgi:glycosyltransferase involved in cell wall biosynthesis
MQPSFSLAYTSVRAASVVPVINAWRSSATGRHPIEVVIAVDGNGQATLAEARKVPEARVLIQPEPPFNCVKGWNLAASATTGKVIIAVADDFRPCPAWDEKLFTLRTGWMDEDYAVHVEDGYVHDLMVLAIITRKRYERFGYLFYPGYESVFCDTELTEVAYREGRVLDAKHIFIEHQHPDCNKRPRDGHDLLHASKERWARGELLFNFRKSQNFPNDLKPEPVKSDPTSPAPTSAYDGYAAYIQANRDDLCLAEVVDRLFDEGLRHFFFCVPDTYWSGRPTKPEEMQQVFTVADAVVRRGADAWKRVFCVADYRFPGDSRITVETRVRNDALAWVRQHGFLNIAVVDSDELWPRGCLALIKERVDRLNPAAISLPMIPVVGFPGYPIEGATDRVIAYVGQSCIFRDCRTPIGPVCYENGATVYHFTSTRRSMEETINKHRESGHFDDPSYDTEWWIKNALPHIRPGFQPAWPDGRRGIHWFKTYQIWPAVRSWTETDLRHIPDTIRPYLGIHG